MTETMLKKFLIGATIDGISLEPDAGDDPDASYDSMQVFCSNGAILTISYMEYEGLVLDLIGPPDPCPMVEVE